MSSPETGIEIVAASELDSVAELRPVLNTTVRDSETGYVLQGEITDILNSVHSSSFNHRQYVVARQISDGTVLGMMGLQRPDDAMQTFAMTERPGELINAYVMSGHRQAGIGSRLVKHLAHEASSAGYSELVVNSGPRYMKTGWPFWNRMFGAPVGMAEDYYGEGYHAMVWSEVFGAANFRAAVPLQSVKAFQNLAGSRWDIRPLS